MYNVCFCDDNIEEIYELKNIVSKYFDNNGYSYNFDYLESGNQVLNALLSGKRYDIIFLDILMPELDGVELARQLRALNEKCAIIFVTFSKDYAIEGYKVDAFDYVLKPVCQEDIKRTLAKLITRITETGTIAVQFNSKNGFIEFDTHKIKYLESSGHYVSFHFKDSDVVRMYGSMSNFAPMLTRYSFFVRCHKSYTVNLNFVKGLKDSCFVLKDGTIIPISRQNQHTSKKKYSDFILNKML